MRSFKVLDYQDEPIDANGYELYAHSSLLGSKLELSCIRGLKGLFIKNTCTRELENHNSLHKAELIPKQPELKRVTAFADSKYHALGNLLTLRLARQVLEVHARSKQ